MVCAWVLSALNGLDVAENVTVRSPGTSFIIMTGLDFEDTAVEQSPPVDPLLAKPFDCDKVNLVLNEAALIRLDQSGGGTDHNA